jgi:hypothetical protein
MVQAPIKPAIRLTDPTGKRDTEEAEQPTSDSGPDDAEHNVHQKPHLALHELP